MTSDVTSRRRGYGDEDGVLRATSNQCSTPRALRSHRQPNRLRGGQLALCLRSALVCLFQCSMLHRTEHFQIFGPVPPADVWLLLQTDVLQRNGGSGLLLRCTALGWAALHQGALLHHVGLLHCSHCSG